MTPDYGDLGTRLLADAQIRAAAATFFHAAAEAGIRAAPIKGLALSTALYDDPIERSFGDVDVLVSKQDIPAIIELARRRGFELVFDSKQLGCVNIIVPPGIPFDVRASIGPPAFARTSATQVLARSTLRHDPRVCDAPLAWLQEHDHLSVLVVDAVMDKLAEKRSTRINDLRRALDRWVAVPEVAALHFHRAGLSVAAHLVMRWLSEVTGERKASLLADALRPLPPFASVVSSLISPMLRDAPSGYVSRVGVRMLADQPARAFASLALGAAGVIHYRARNAGGRPWHGQLWRGPVRGAPGS